MEKVDLIEPTQDDLDERAGHHGYETFHEMVEDDKAVDPDLVWECREHARTSARLRAAQEAQTNAKTLRDEFAMAALSTVAGLPAADVATWGVGDYATHSYAIADAMMAERLRRDGLL